MRRTTPILAVTVLLSGLRWGPAEAAFNVCNKTKLTARVSLGRFDGTNWTSEGWWTIKAADLCRHPDTARCRAAFIISMPAMAPPAPGKARPVSASRPTAALERRDGMIAPSRGFEPPGLFEVDTGKKPDWTQTLSN